MYVHVGKSNTFQTQVFLVLLMVHAGTAQLELRTLFLTLTTTATTVYEDFRRMSVCTRRRAEAH